MTRDFWCDDCRAWTLPDAEFCDYPICAECGAEFQCGECGGAIEFDGACERGEIHA